MGHVNSIAAPPRGWVCSMSAGQSDGHRHSSCFPPGRVGGRIPLGGCVRVGGGEEGNATTHSLPSPHVPAPLPTGRGKETERPGLQRHTRGLPGGWEDRFLQA